jgi:predicted O-methyltransferase YrrM
VSPAGGTWLPAILVLAAALLAAGLVLAGTAYGLRRLHRSDERHFRQLERRLEEHLDARLERGERQVRALVNVRPLAGPLPLDLGGWPAEPVLADLVLRHVLRRRPALVAECGSGWSTLLLTLCLEELGRGRVVSLEDGEAYARRTRALLEERGVPGRATVVHAPLTRELGSLPARRWYDADLEALFPEPIGLLLVDGPPGDEEPRARYPAVPLLRSKLAPGAAVILDDGAREGERWIAARWGEELGVQPTYLPWGEGIWVLELPPS